MDQQITAAILDSIEPDVISLVNQLVDERLKEIHVQNPSDMLTTRQAYELITGNTDKTNQAAAQYMRRLVQTKQIRKSVVNNVIRYRRSEVERYIEEHTVTGSII